MHIRLDSFVLRDKFGLSQEAINQEAKACAIRRSETRGWVDVSARPASVPVSLDGEYKCYTFEIWGAEASLSGIKGYEMNYEDQYDHYLFKFNVYDSNFLIMHRSELPPLGFSSLYAITKADAEALVSASTSVNFKGSVWSSHLVLDIDDYSYSEEVMATLLEMGLEFESWSTGNRGRHYYITRPHSPSHILPQLDKEWVKSTFPGADTSIYSNLHLFRQAGATHDKTGQKKKLMSKFRGNPLILPDHLTQNYHTSHKSGKDVTESIFLDRRVMSLTVPCDEGRRHETLLNLGVTLCKRGEPLEFIKRWLEHSNLLFSQPKPPEELDRIMQFLSEVEVD